jgi:hypothetical protein
MSDPIPRGKNSHIYLFIVAVIALMIVIVIAAITPVLLRQHSPGVVPAAAPGIKQDGRVQTRLRAPRAGFRHAARHELPFRRSCGTS